MRRQLRLLILAFAAGVVAGFFLFSKSCGPPDKPIVIPGDSSRVERADTIPPPPLSKTPVPLKATIRWLKGDTILITNPATRDSLNKALDELAFSRLTWDDSLRIYQAIAQIRFYTDTVSDKNATSIVSFHTLGPLVSMDEHVIQHHRAPVMVETRKPWLEINSFGINTSWQDLKHFNGVGGWVELKRGRSVLKIDANLIDQKPAYFLGLGRTL